MQSRRSYLRGGLCPRLLAIACLLATPGTANAQTHEADSLQRRGTWTVAPFVGFARNSPTGRWGSTPDRDHFFLGVHLTAPVLRVGPVTLSYAPNIVPLAVVSDVPRYHRDDLVLVVPGDGSSAANPVPGAGFSPAGLQLGLRVSPRLELYGAGAVGGLWFASDVPEPGARRFNYTFEYGGGATYRVDPQRAVQAGYKFHHLSNLYTANYNPGLDAHVFYAGLQWSVRARRE